ncbi:MAG: glycosyltransferase family 2 protein [Nitrospirae bacterium]|nr:glycosyltransferase family 2 protein [Nitrospirota bacterium]MBF0542193.1 glycosyltransferase family 2 protein [Nitrospirota bacterium]
MTNLRIFGLFCGLVSLIFTFRYYRRDRWNRTNFLLLFSFTIFLILVNINPNILNSLRDLLSFEKMQYGRIIALLILSDLFLLFYTFYIRANLDSSHEQFDLLIRKLSASSISDVEIESLRSKAIIIVMPAYNEEENLKTLLPKIPSEIRGLSVGVLVLDDGSTDETVNVVKSMNFVCIQNIIHRGQGAANRLGYDILLSLNTQICVTMDADNQHRPEDLETLISAILDKNYDLVIGSRMIGATEKNSPLRLAGVVIFSWIISRITGIKLTDCSSGYKAMNRKWLKTIKLREDQFQATEVIISTAKGGLSIGEVPITMAVRIHGKSKKGPDLTYGLHFARVLFKTWIKK